MSLFDRFGSQHDGQEVGFKALKVDAGLRDIIQTPFEREGLTVRPHKDNGGIEAMDDVLESLHTVETKSPRLSRSAKNVSPAHTFEMRYAAPSAADERVVSLQYLAGDEGLAGTLARQLQTQYPQSQVATDESPMFLHAEEGQYIAGATLGLRRYTLLPIKNIDLPGFRTDPTGSVLEEMVGAQRDDVADADVIVQIMFKPARREWTEGVSGGLGELDKDDSKIKDGVGIRDLSFNLRQPSYEMRRRLFTWEKIEHPPSKVDKQVAQLLEEQQGEKGWRLCLRVFAISDDPAVATSRASKVSGMFRNFYESNTEQTFIPKPLQGDSLREQVRMGAEREFYDTGLVKSQREVAGLVNVPEARYVNTSKMQWSLSRPGEGVPVGTPRFDFDQADLPDVPTREEKQVTMLDHSEPGDPFWFGFGRKNGTEVGVYEEYLNAHMMVTGGTRKGKTTTLTNFASQVYDRGYGALVIVNGKEQDEDRFIEEWPEDRPEEDFVFIDTGDEFDQRVRFNLLEVPTDAEPGTNTYESAVNTLADDWAASFAEAGGGSDSYFGPLMERITRTVINGLSKSGRTCTPLDIAAAVSTSDGLGQFSEWMDEERIHFVKEAAERIAEKEDRDLEPLAGRTDLLTQHAGLRNFMSARNPTASIQEFVREGKVCVLRIDPNLGESEIKFMLTPIVRRFYTAKKTLPDAPRFYLIWDEFDKAVSPRTNIHEMLSIAGGHDFRMVLACQAPSNQLYDELKNALQNQVDTAISFGTGKDDAKYIQSHHSFDDPSDLTGLGRFKFWLRTYYRTADDEDKTYSYKVDAFPPARETRQNVLGDAYNVDVTEMKRRSVERYGDVPETAEELKAESHFYGEGTDADDHASLTDERKHTILSTVFRYEVELDQTVIPATIITDALTDRLDEPKHVVETLLNSCNSRGLIRVDQDGGNGAVALTDDGYEHLFSSGDENDMNKGGIVHQAAMKRLIHELTEFGYEMTIPMQGGEEMPDLYGTLPIETGGKTFEEAKAKVEQLKAEYPAVYNLSGEKPLAVEFEKSTKSKPKQIGHNLRKALVKDDPEHVLFVVNEGAEEFADYAEYIASKLTGDILVNERPPADVSRRFLHQEPLQTDDEITIAVPDSNVTLQWVDINGSVVLRSGDGEVFARFESTEDFANATRHDFPAHYSPSTEGYTLVDEARDTIEEYETMADLREEWTTVYAPFIPELEFGELPTPDQWDVAVLPDDDDDPLYLYDHETGDSYPIGTDVTDEPDGTEGTEGTDSTDGDDELAQLAKEAGIEDW